ncbi:DUF3644 domain-containing protein [Paenibacillus camelliae]|nr:DUF3644 domain-containing protein [Paenibacillus camelliae]
MEKLPNDNVYKNEDKMVEKSIEAFILGIEIYNKPTIKYRVEGFSFFICNAWELMLKSYLIKTMGQDCIYYKDNRDRTITLENCIRLIFTNDKDPLRLNLEKIVQLRNTSTHFITTEYEMVYVPLFQACVLNYSEKMSDFHGIDMTSYIPQNFLALNISMEAIDNTKIIAKYPEEIAKKLINANEELLSLSSVKNPNFAIVIEHHHYIVKDKKKATSFVGIDNSADAKVKIIKEVRDISKTHPYNAKKCIERINKKLEGLDISVKVNQHSFGLLTKYYSLKGNDNYHYPFETGTITYHSYSQQTIDLIVNEIKNDPVNIIHNIKEALKNK